MLVVVIDSYSCKVQNITHCSEADNTEDSYLLSVVKEVYISMYAACFCVVCLARHQWDVLSQGYNRAHN